MGVVVLDRYILLEAGAVKREVEDCQHGVGGSDLLDARLRVCSEGPDETKNLHEDSVVVEATKVFLTEKSRRLHSHQERTRKAHSEETKEKMSVAHKRPRQELTKDPLLLDEEQFGAKPLGSDVEEDVEILATDADVVSSAQLWEDLGDSLTAIRGSNQTLSTFES